MTFLNQITAFINDELKAGSLNKKKLQPAKFYGLSSVINRSTKGSKDPGKLEQLPAIVSNEGQITVITPDSKLSLQVYHKLLTKTYGLEKKSFGDQHFIKSTSELSMVVIANSKLTGSASFVLEPVVLFGMPQKLSDVLMAELKISKCLITPLASNMDPMQVFKQEFPQSDYFLTQELTMFLIRYRIETTFAQSCVDSCLCD